MVKLFIICFLCLKVNIKNIEEMEKFLKDKNKYKNEALELNIDMTLNYLIF